MIRRNQGHVKGSSSRSSHDPHLESTLANHGVRHVKSERHRHHSSTPRSSFLSSPNKKKKYNGRQAFSPPDHLNVHSRNTCHFVTPLPASRTKQAIERKQVLLQQSRAHLKNVRVLQNSAILILGLPKKEFQTAKLIEKEFRKYGVITNCLTNPKGISFEELNDHPISLSPTSSLGLHPEISCKNSRPRTLPTPSAVNRYEAIGPVYIRYLNERSAMNAILATNGQIWGINGQSFQLWSCFVNNRFCDEFLHGRFCKDLNCVLLHELMKDDHRKRMENNVAIVAQKSPFHCNNFFKSPRAQSSTSSGGANNSSKEGSLMEQCTLYDKKGYVHALVGRNDSNTNRRRHGGTQEQSSPSTQMKESKRNGNPAQIATPQKQKFHDIIITPNSSMSSYHKEVDILSATHCNHIHILGRKKSYQSDLPAKQLFKSRMNNVIGPPIRETESHVQNGIDNPWAIHSPVMIESDNFDTISNNQSQSHNDHITSTTTTLHFQ